MPSATTAMPASIGMTALTPGTASALAGSWFRTLAPKAGLPGDRRHEHARDGNVAAERAASGDVQRNFDARQRLADEAELRGLLEGDGLAFRQRLCRRGDGAIGEATPAWHVHDRTALGAAFGWRDAPLGGCRRHQSLARRRCRAPQRQPGRAHARAAAGGLGSDQRVGILPVGRGKFRSHLGELDLQLLGDKRRQRRDDALPHLRPVDDDGDRVVAVDAHPRIGGEQNLGRARRHCRSRLGNIRRPRCALGRQVDGAADTLVGAAAAQHPRHPLLDVGVAWRGVAREQGGRRHDHAGLAVTALRYLRRDPGVKQRRRAVGGQPLDGGDCLSGGVG